MKLLTVQDVELIHIQVIDVSGGSQGTRNAGRIESVIAAQTQEVFGTELYSSIYDKAAAMLRGIIADHPFIDGNKRTAMITALTFLNLNSCDTSDLKDRDLEDFAVKVATDHLDVPIIADWLEAHCS